MYSGAEEVNTTQSEQEECIEEEVVPQHENMPQKYHDKIDGD